MGESGEPVWTLPSAVSHCCVGDLLFLFVETDERIGEKDCIIGAKHPTSRTARTSEPVVKHRIFMVSLGLRKRIRSNALR